MRVAQDLLVSSKAAAAFFLLSHGSVKLALVLAVMRGFAWAYPAFLGALGLLIGYQTPISSGMTSLSGSLRSDI